MRPTSESIVIIAPAVDDQARAVRAHLLDMGAPCVIVDPTSFPGELRISLSQDPRAVCIDGDELIPAAVYLRNLASSPISTRAAVERREQETSQDWRRAHLARRERADVISAVVQRWEHLGIPIYNPPSVRYRITKPFQLALLADAGLPVPDSLWTNDPDRVRDFAAGRRIAYKPIAGGAATRELSKDDLARERLETLRNCPVTFQELLPGDDIRVYVLDDEVIAAMLIETDALDFRQNETDIRQIELGAQTLDQCRLAARTLGLRFTGMDLKGDHHGQLKFLECNPSPMFVGFDHRAGTQIARALADALASHTLRPALHQKSA